MAKQRINFDDPAEAAAALKYQKHVDRLRDQSKREVAAERAGCIVFPQILTLRQRLARTPEPVRWRITKLQKIGQRVILAAQFKAGKTTAVISVVRALLDDVPFLDTYDVSPVTRLALLDFEMAEEEPGQLDDWYRDAGIVNEDGLVIVPLRGRAGAFNILDEAVRAEWVVRLRGTEYLVLDCLRPVLDALGLDENRETGRFFIALDALLLEAGIRECLVIHHMGHANERSRGDSRILDWPDVNWTLVRENDDPSSTRFFKAFGRGVDLPETRLVFNSTTKRLAVEGGGSRANQKIEAALVAVMAFLGRARLANTRAIYKHVKLEGHGEPALRKAVKLGIDRKAILTSPGPNQSVLHFLATDEPPVEPRVKEHSFADL